jgi:LmbE family N-acetylglucosaminyl deacetylase
MLTARERIERQMADPALIRLHRKLSRLKSTVTMMNTGAHPDDEQNGMLAWFRLGLGMRVIIACSTRGEGGQNALGPERLGALGVIRSRELEEAARAIDSDVCWLGHGPSDPVHDFGFSKDGDATFERWGETRAVERLVRAYRSQRPDIVIPTFLDVPGQHGHHRAMTRAAEKALSLAADAEAFPEHFVEGLKPWSVAKYYLPAWSGGGDTYDDELPPPDVTLTVEVDGREPASGAEYDRIGEWSRYYHASQGMGRWPRKPTTTWPLHLKTDSAHRQEQSILDGLSSSLSLLADAPGLGAQAGEALRAADTSIATAITAFPDRAAVVTALCKAADCLEKAELSASAPFLSLHGHRITRKRCEVDAAILDAAEVFERAFAEPSNISPGSSSTLTVELGEGGNRFDVATTLALPQGVAHTMQPRSDELAFVLSAADDTALSGLYLPTWSALGGNGHAHVEISAIINGRQVLGMFDLDEPFSVTPAQSVILQPDALIVPLGKGQKQWPVAVTVSGTHAPISFDTPDGWTINKSGEEWFATSVEDVSPGLSAIIPKIHGHPAYQMTSIDYSHIGHTRFRAPATLKVLGIDLTLPQGARVGYVGGGADKVGLWLSRMGIDVIELDGAKLCGDLTQFTTIVVGIFAFGIRKDLAAATEKLHQFVENGGHLLTLYHRPSDGWDPERTPVRRIDIGSPSLRWRVTDPAAEVTVLEPDHFLLKGPNLIGQQDWQGWDKERGLYFASRWDEAYQPLLAMHDVNEQPLKGALISGAIGKGRHTHTSLVLHHQLDRLVPGAFRLLANLVQPA